MALPQQPCFYPDELQSPVAARKSTPDGGTARRLDPIPIVRLRYWDGAQMIAPQMIPNHSLSHLFCQVDLFRLPPLNYTSPPHMGFTYYAHQGQIDQHGNKVFVLLHTQHPQNFSRDIVHQVNNHLVLESSEESTLLYGPHTVQAHEHPETRAVLFVFPHLGVTQTGQFIMRYRVYDRRLQAMLGQCFGSPFNVFQGQAFPGFENPTPLTMSLASLNIPGVRASGRRTSQLGGERMDVATPTRIDAIDDSFLGRKLRVAGQILAYDPHDGIALLRSGAGADGDAVLLDVATCVSSWPAGNREWLGEHLATVMAIGYLEKRDDLRLPTLPRHVAAPRVAEGLVLQVLLVAPSVGLDLRLWNAGVDALSALTMGAEQE
uniref:Velvet domain-containing protein n=1 Tax=Mycena chlorophos TaxID=658473 RepID=A0ABQ0LYR3_MYCCL|nr:predicted protein [Mycena chlorophos]